MSEVTRYGMKGRRYIGKPKKYYPAALRLDAPEKVTQEKCLLVSIADSFKKIVVAKDGIWPYMDDTASLP